jgi:hypothetical protein
MRSAFSPGEASSGRTTPSVVGSAIALRARSFAIEERSPFVGPTACSFPLTAQQAKSPGDQPGL